MRGFVLTGHWKEIKAVLQALAELEWELPQLMALLDGQVIRLG